MFGLNIKATFLCLLWLLVDVNVEVVLLILLNLLDVILFVVVCGLVIVLLELTLEVNNFEELDLEEDFVEVDILTVDDFPEVEVTTDFEELLLKLEVETAVV